MAKLDKLELHILDLLSEGAYSMKELYCNIVGEEYSTDDLFRSLLTLNKKSLISLRLEKIDEGGLDREAIDDVLDACLPLAKKDWTSLPSYQLDPSQEGYAILRELGVGHP